MLFHTSNNWTWVLIKINSRVQFCACVTKEISFLDDDDQCTHTCACGYHTKTWAAEFISCSSRFLSRKRACSKLCSSTPNLTSIPVISLLICDIAFFIFTSGAATNTKRHNSTDLEQTQTAAQIFSYFTNVHCSSVYFISPDVPVLLTNAYFIVQMTPLHLTLMKCKLNSFHIVNPTAIHSQTLRLDI